MTKKELLKRIRAIDDVTKVSAQIEPLELIDGTTSCQIIVWFKDDRLPDLGVKVSDGIGAEDIFGGA